MIDFAFTPPPPPDSAPQHDSPPAVCACGCTLPADLCERREAVRLRLERATRSIVVGTGRFKPAPKEKTT